MTRVTLAHVSRRFGSVAAVRDLDLDVESGQMVALLGPSGCGKTTTLRMIAGLLDPSEGDVLFDGQSMLSVRTERRGAVMVFQKHLLFPTMSVADNVGFGLRMQKVAKPEIRRRVDEMLALVRLPDMGGRQAHELSGGQQQRVALARALVVRPRVLLLDEPLANLDTNLRIEMRELIRSIQAETGITSLFVTHDHEEAVMLADRVALILSGVLQQYGNPSDFYERPRSVDVARFFRNNNLLDGERAGCTVSTALGQLCVDPMRSNAGDGPVLVSVRPEDVAIVEGGAPEPNVVTAEVVANVYVGTHRRLVVSLDGREWHLEGPTDAPYGKGDVVRLRLAPDHIWLFPADNTYVKGAET